MQTLEAPCVLSFPKGILTCTKLHASIAKTTACGTKVTEQASSGIPVIQYSLYLGYVLRAPKLKVERTTEI